MKFFFLVFFAIFSSCSKKNLPLVNTEIICPFRPSILVKFVTSKELKYSAIQDYIHNNELGKNPKLTVFRLKDGRSFSVRIPPQEIIECDFRQSPFGAVDSNYVHSF